MTTTARRPDGLHDDEGQEPVCAPLSAQQAQAWRARHRSLSPWGVIGGQVVVGALVALLAWLVTGRASAGWSAAYGGLAVVLPAVVFARGLTGRFSSISPGAAVLGFFVWEAVKLALAIALLLAAPRLVTALSWPALLVGLVVTMKVYWLALALRGKAPASGLEGNG